MEYRTFFVFPDNEDVILELGDDPAVYRDVILQINRMKTIFKKDGEYKLWFDSQNVAGFIAKAKTIVPGEYLDNIGTQLRLLLKNAMDIQYSSQVDQNCVYMRLMSDWTFVDTVPLMQEAAETLAEPSGLFLPVIVSISGAVVDDNRDTINIIKDASYLNDLPRLSRIPFFREEMEFRAWIETRTGASDFSLRNKQRFTATGKLWVKQMIYKENQTDQYWYFDFFHKDNRQHYEVFDSVGLHLGEAGIDGVLIHGTQDANKKISHII
jgi:hypothetical protein